MTVYHVIVIFSVFVSAIAQMLLKKGAGVVCGSIFREYLNLWVICGYGLMGISLLVNVFAMSRGVLLKDVSIIESLSYIFVPVLASLIFREKISRRKIISTILIFIGIIIFFH